MNARDLLRRARVQLLIRCPFFRHLASYLELQEMPPAMKEVALGPIGTDGKALYYNPEEVVKIQEDVLVGVWCHEVSHPAFGHLWRRERETR